MGTIEFLLDKTIVPKPRRNIFSLFNSHLCMQSRRCNSLYWRAVKCMRICTTTTSSERSRVNLQWGEGNPRGGAKISGWVGRGRPPKRSGGRSFRYEFMHSVALNSLRTGKREGRRIFGASTGPFQGVINPFKPCIRDAKCRLLCEALGAVRDIRTQGSSINYLL